MGLKHTIKGIGKYFLCALPNAKKKENELNIRLRLECTHPTFPISNTSTCLSHTKKRTNIKNALGTGNVAQAGGGMYFLLMKARATSLRDDKKGQTVLKCG